MKSQVNVTFSTEELKLYHVANWILLAQIQTTLTINKYIH